MEKIVKQIISCIVAVIMAFYCITYTAIQTANAATPDIIISITADKEMVNTDDILTVSVIVKHFQSTIHDDINPIITGIQAEVPIDTDTYEFIDFVNSGEGDDDIPLFINTDSSQSVNYDPFSKSVKCVGLNSDTPYIKENENDILLMKFKLKAKKTAPVSFLLGKTIFDNMLYKNGKEPLQYCVIQLASAVKYGDVNNDGLVNIEDAVTLKKVLAGVNIFYHFGNSDINNDYQVNSSDAILLLKHLAGINVGI